MPKHQRRHQATKPPEPVTLDHDRAAFKVGNGPDILLTLTEFKIAAKLVGACGRIVNRDSLKKAIGVAIGSRTVDEHVSRIRRKLGNAAGAIETRNGFGYRWST